MRTRPATLDDLPALTSLQGRWDTHWFGAPEHDPMKTQANVGGGKMDALQQKRCIQQRLPRARRRARGLPLQRA